MKLFRTIQILIFLLIISCLKSFSQEASFYGARNESLANAAVALSDSWALFYNPAGLMFNQVEVLAGYQSKYTALGLNDGSFGFTFPIKNTALGIGASYFGDQLLSKSKLVASLAHKIGVTSLGLKTTYEQLRVDEIGSKGTIYIDIGGQIIISKQVTLGMVISNLNQAKFDTLSLSSPTTNVQVGLNYHPHKKLILLAQIEKPVSSSFLLKFGLEYLVSNTVSIRTGLTPSPTSAYAGIGIDWQRMNLDLVGSYKDHLGWSGGVSIGIPIAFKNED